MNAAILSLLLAAGVNQPQHASPQALPLPGGAKATTLRLDREALPSAAPAVFVRNGSNRAVTVEGRALPIG